MSTEDKQIESRLSASLGKPVRFLAGAPASGTLEEYWPDIDGLARRDVVTDEAMPPGTFFDCAVVHFSRQPLSIAFGHLILKAGLSRAAFVQTLS